MSQALILFAHGARDPAWAAPFEAVAALIRSRQPSWQVRLAYLEFMSPPLAEAAKALADAGCSRIVIRPMFLGTGGHVRRDLPLLLDGLRLAHPGVDFVLQDAIGENRAVHAAMADTIAAELWPQAGGAP